MRLFIAFRFSAVVIDAVEGILGIAVHGRRVLLALVTLALLAAGVWAWSHGFTGPYHFDDYTTPLDDPASESWSAWRQHLAVTLRPLTKLTYALEAESPLTNNAAARRAVSLVLLGVTAGLLLCLIRRLAPGATLAGATLLAAVWFLHPVHADAVLLASGRSAVLSSLLVIAALLMLDRSRPLSAALLLALACLSRETAIAAVLPLGVLAAERHPGRWRAALRELAPSLAAAAVVALWILATPRYLQLAEYSLLGRPVLASLFSQVGAMPVGLGLLFWPGGLSIDYGIALPASSADPLFVLGLVLYAAAIAGVFAFWRRCPAAAVGLALWLAALLPTQSAIPKLDALSNRPLTLALAGLLLAAAPLVQAAVARSLLASASHADRSRSGGWRGVVGFTIAATLIAALSLGTAGRASLFQSELQLWRDAAAKSRVNERPYVKYGLLSRQAGNEHDALEALTSAARINPFSAEIAATLRSLRPREVSR